MDWLRVVQPVHFGRVPNKSTSGVCAGTAKLKDIKKEK